MAVDEKPSSVSIEGNAIVIEDHVIDDPEIVEFFQTQDEPPEELLSIVTRIGVSTLQLSETTEELEYVKRQFNDMSSEFEDRLEDVNDDLENWFHEDDGDFRDLVEELFNHRTDETPIGKLYDDLEEKLEEIKTTIIEDKTKAELEQETTKKGDNFEDDLEPILGSLTRKSDEVLRTGDDHGQLDDRFVGDFVIKLGDTKQKIVIEAKNVSNIYKPDIKEELLEGIANRQADYGILVLNNEEASPSKLGAFREFDQQMLYVAISGEESDMYDTRLLNLALEWARMRTVSEQFDTDDDVDVERIQSKIAEVEDSISRFKNVRDQCSNIEKARRKIKSELAEIEEEVEEELEEITREIQVE